MKNNSKIYLLILIGLLISIAFSCKKDADNLSNQNEIPDFDPLVAIESKVNINTNEIGGSDLILVSSQDEKSTLFKGSFNTVVSKIGEQFLIIKDKNEKIRALTLSTPTSNIPDVMEINAASTAITLIFISPGVITIDAEEAVVIIQNIKEMSSYLEFETLLRNQLKNRSLSNIVNDENYISLLKKCLIEYSGISTTKSATPFTETKNTFRFTFTGSSIKLENIGFRFVNVIQRDLNAQNAELSLNVVSQEMHGAVPFSWGSFFTSSNFSPTIENLNFSMQDNTSLSEFWIVGPGNIFKNSVVPNSISEIEQPWAETIVYYIVFPFLDCWAGAKTFTNMTSSQFRDLMNKIKITNSGILISKAKDEVSFYKALIDFFISSVGIIASYSTIGTGSTIAAIVAKFLSLTSGVFGAANLTIFATNMLLIDPYSEFIVKQENETGTVTDINGNIYKTVKIGDQWWMAENLKTTKYNNGTNIPNVTDNLAWDNLITPGYCWYNNDNKNKSIYGALYNWYAVNDNRKIAPAGWHVATNAEWITLNNYVASIGGSNTEESSVYWHCPNTDATNFTGFSAVPGGGRYNQGSFNDLGYIAYWWCSTEGGKVGEIQLLYNDDCGVANKNFVQSSGVSVRCVKD